MFGDITEEIQYGSAATETSTGVKTFTANPAADDLLSALHFSGDATSDCPTSGFNEDQLLTNTSEDDEAAFYSKVSTGASDKSVECTSPVADAHMLIFQLIAGAFAASPKDLSASSGRVTSSPSATGASGGSTAQADEFMTALHATRHAAPPGVDDQTAAWVRQGSATPTSDMTDADGVTETAQLFKRLESAQQVLTATGTVGVSRAWTGDANIGMIGYCTYKKAAAGAGALPPFRPLALKQPLLGF